MVEVKQCKYCNSTDLKKDSYVRGWNKYTKSGVGDVGSLCGKCFKITWSQTLESFKAIIPDWCIHYRD